MKTARLDAEQRRDLLLDASRADLGKVIGMRAGASIASSSLAGAAPPSSTLTPARRDELLAKLRAGGYVELELELEAYSQAPGVMNRKFIRIRDGAMQALGRSGKSTPLMRDHDQGNVLARGGTIIASKSDSPVDGHYTIQQTAKLSAPWAVELALLGLIDRLSIGMNPTGPVLCSLCGTEIFDECWHMRGQTVEDDDGNEQTVEWIFTAAELVETSVVSVPAVPSARIESIRAALAGYTAPERRGPRAVPVPRSEEDAFISDALKCGLIKPYNEDNYRMLFRLSPDAAKRLAYGLDQPEPEPEPEPVIDLEATRAAVLNVHAIEFARVFGAPDPAKAVADVAARRHG